MNYDENYLSVHVVWIVSRHLEYMTWFKGIPPHMAPSQEQVKAVGIKQAVDTLEQQMRDEYAPKEVEL